MKNPINTTVSVAMAKAVATKEAKLAKELAKKKAAAQKRWVDMIRRVNARTPMPFTVMAAKTNCATLMGRASTEQEARAIANAAYKAKAGTKITLRSQQGVVAKATIGINAEDKDAAYAKSVVDTMPAEQEGRHNLPRCPRWLLSVVTEEALISQTFVVPNRKQGHEALKRLDVEGQRVVLFHNLAAVECSPAICSSHRKLVQMATARPTINGMMPDGAVYQGVTPTMRHLGTDVIKVHAEIKSMDEEVYARKCAAYERMIRNGFMWNGEKFAVYGHGTNAAKDCEVKAADASRIAELRKWQTNGANDDWRVAVAKFFAYAGLMDVALAMNYPKWLTPDSEIIVPSLKKQIEGNIADVYGNGTVEGPVWKLLEQNSSDGQAVLCFSEKKVKEILSKLHGQEREAAERFFNTLRSHSFRWPLQKGFVVVMVVDAAQTWLRLHGVSEINGKNIDDIVVFADETVFKGSLGEGGSHKDWNEYCENFARLHDEYSGGVLLENHGVNRPATRISAQNWRALVGASKDMIDAAMQMEVNHLLWKATTVEGIASLIGGKLGKAIKNKPELLRIPVIRQQAEKALTVLLAEARQGRFHDLAHNLSWATDIFGWLLNAAGIDKVVIPAGMIIIPGANWIVNGQVVYVGRSPIQNDSGIQLRVAFNSFAAAGIENGELLDAMVYPDGTAYGSAIDLLDTALEADHDGDHIFVIACELYVRMLEERNDRLAAMGWDNVIVKAHTAKAEKVIITEEVINTYLANLTTKVNVGKPDDDMSKLIAMVPVGEMPTLDILRAAVQIKFRMQDSVDAGKHSKTTELFAEMPLVASLSGMKVPYSVELAKAERRGTEMPKEREFGDGTLDYIRQTMTEAVKDIHIDIKDLPELDSRVFQLNRAERMPALYNFVGKPKYRFFPMDEKGNLDESPADVLFYDSADEAECSIVDGLFTKERGKRTVSSSYGCIHVDNETVVLNVSMEPVAGKWICDEARTPLFSALESRIREEYSAMMADDDQRKLVSGFMAEKGEFARIAIASYAALFGYTLEDAYNKVAVEIFKDRDWLNPNAGDWRPNWFAYQWFITVFGDELMEAIEQNGVEDEDEVDNLEEDYILSDDCDLAID